MKNNKNNLISYLQLSRLYLSCYSFILPMFMALLITALFFSDSHGLTEPLTVRIGVYENQPKIFTGMQNKVSGFWPELIESIAEKEQWQIEYVHGTWNEGLTRLQSNSIDILPDVAITEERARIFTFSKDPILMSWSRLYVHGDNKTIQSIRDLSGKKVAALENSVNLEGPDGFRELLTKFDVSCKFIVFDTYSHVFQAIADKQVDVGMANREFGQENAEKYKLKKTPILFQPINIQFAFYKDSKKSVLLRETIDGHIAELKKNENSLYYRLLDKYFESEIAEKTVFVFPAWLKTILLVSTILLFIFFSVIIATRIQVQRKTREIRRINRDLQRLATAIEQASEIVMITDKKGSIEYVNPVFEILTGYSRDEALGQNPRIMKSGQHDQTFYEEMWATLLRGEVWKGRLVNRKKDGSLLEEYAAISPVKSDDGKIRNFVAVKRDMSRERALEKQLQQAQKMEAVGTLAGGIAHDFNNILTSILGYSEMAREQLLPGDKIRKDLDQVITAGHRATDLVKQILTFSRLGEENLQPLKVQVIIKEALKLLRASLPATIQLKEYIDMDCRAILADPTQIHQILMNLYTNARDAIGENVGILSVSLSEMKVTDVNTMRNCPQIPPGIYLKLEISDTGCGMDSLTRSNIFDPFFTTKQRGKGTGLGLSVVHGIIKQHKGEINVVSELGQGTIFQIYLPIIEAAPLANLNKVEVITKGKGERILFVDDEPAIATLMQRNFDSLGYAANIFSSSIEAFETYKENPDNFDLVITDMTMPEMSGLDLAKKILALRPNLPVIICTGFNETIDEAKAKSFGICKYITKPVDKRTMAIAIREALLH